MEEQRLNFEIDQKSSEPKYKQIVNAVIENIEAGNIKTRFKLPSITELSVKYLVSRDTVEKAYNLLRDQGIIESAMGKGHYVLVSSPKSTMRVFVLFNKLSSYKKVIYHTLANKLKDKANLELFVYHCNINLFESYINEKLGRYNYYLIMSHFDNVDKARIAGIIKKISPEKLILLDNLVEGVKDFRGAVYQDFKMDIYDALVEGLDRLKRFKKMVIVFPNNVPYPYPRQIVEGFKRFCGFNQFEYEIIDELNEDYVAEKGTAYLVIEENDLANLIKSVRRLDLNIPRDIGIISYNDTPLKEVLLGGISVVTTNFEQLGTTAANMILNQEKGSVKNEFKLILRNTL